MKRFFSLLFVPLLFLCSWLFAGAPQPGIAARPTANQATTFFEHVGRIAQPVVAVATMLGLMACGFAWLAQVCGPQAAIALFLLLLCLGMPKPRYILGLTAVARSTSERPGEIVYLKMAAVKILAGTIVAINASGYAAPGADTANFVGVGRAEETIDNSGGAAGDLSIQVKRGVFKWKNSAANAITVAHLGTICYVEDNETVAYTANNAVKAGIVIEIESDGVWVDMRYHLPVAGAVANGAVTTAKLADAVADQIFATTVAVANTGVPDGVAHITGQVQDAQGNSLAGRFLVRVYLDDAAYGDPADLGTATALANSRLLNETVDDAYIDVLTHSDGSWGVELDTAADGTVHAHAAVVGKFATANAAITGNP